MSKKKAKPPRPFGRGRSRKLANGLEIAVFDGPPVGPGVEVASPEEVLAAIERLDPNLPWPDVRDLVVPMLPRVRPYPAPAPDPVRLLLPPGILVGFAIDVGPALTVIGGGLLESWGLDAATLCATALRNLRARAEACDVGLVHRDAVTDVPVGFLQTGVGIAASFLLVPEHLERFFGRGPHLLIAPMRDVLIALPADVDREFAAWLAEEFEVLDPNHLHLGGFIHERGIVTPVPLEDALARA